MMKYYELWKRSKYTNLFYTYAMQMWKEFKLSFCRLSPKAMLYFNNFSVTNENKDANHLNISILFLYTPLSHTSVHFFPKKSISLNLTA